MGLLSVFVGIAVVGSSSQPAEAFSLKKIGKSLGKAAKGVTKPVAKAVTTVAKPVGHAAKGVAKGTGKAVGGAANFAVKTTGKAVKTAGNVGEFGLKTTATAAKGTAKGTVAVAKFGVNTTGNAVKTVVRTTDKVILPPGSGGNSPGILGGTKDLAQRGYGTVTSPVRTGDWATPVKRNR
jgi:hypothetical protein